MMGGRRSPDALAWQAWPWALGVTVVTHSPLNHFIFILFVGLVAPECLAFLILAMPTVLAWLANHSFYKKRQQCQNVF
jgi:hypothetical protein